MNILDRYGDTNYYDIMIRMPEQTGEGFIPRDQGASISLMQLIKQNVERESGIKPWWYTELDRFSEALSRFHEKQGVRMSDYAGQNEAKELFYPHNVTDAIHNVLGEKIKYYTWSQSCFVQWGSHNRLPDNKDQAIDQLRVSSWWIGNTQGVSGKMTQDLLTISRLYTEDFPDQARAKFSSNPDMKEKNLEKLNTFGQQLSYWDKETTSVDLQKVYWDPFEQRIVFIPQVTMKVSKTLNGKCRLTMLGTDPYRSEDTRVYWFENPSDGERVIQEIEGSLDLISKQRNKPKKH